MLNVDIVNPSDEEELALTLDGKKKKLKIAHFAQLAKGLGLNPRQIKNIFDGFIKNRPAAYQWLDNSFLSAEYIAAYKGLMDSRYATLE